jgi:undecaprenyl-diphosphatase
MIPLCVGLVLFLLASGRRLDAIWAAATLAGIHLVVTPLLKEAFDRPRPDQGSPIPLPSSDSFPSGHASGSVVTFALVAMFCVERRPGRRRLLWGLAAAFALGSGVSRVVLNVHFVTDVLAGFALGLAWLAAALLASPRARR